MAIKLVCDKCGQDYKVDESMGGKKVRCRHCQNVMAVPKPAAPAPKPEGIEIGLSPSDTHVVSAIDPSSNEAVGLSPGMPTIPRPGVRPDLIPEAPEKQRRSSRRGQDILNKVIQAIYVKGSRLFVLAVVIGIAIGAYYFKDRLKGTIINPPLPSMTEVEPGVLRTRVTLKSTGLMGDAPMDLWVYLPAGTHRTGSLPCIFIAGSGSKLVTGVKITSKDEPEHLPYVRAGFIVVAYDTDGEAKSSGNESEMAKAMKAFSNAEGGVSNARKAIDYVLAQVPQADPRKLYAAGHASAGTLALQLAVEDRRLAGCVAYAPVVDLEAFSRNMAFAREMEAAEKAVSGFKDYVRDASPTNNVDRVSCPVMLFVAEDDKEFDVARQIPTFVKRRPSQFKLVTVRSGGHYNSMIDMGIPAGVKFLGNMAGLSAEAIARGGNSATTEWRTGDAAPAEMPLLAAVDDLLPAPPPPVENYAPLPVPEENTANVAPLPDLTPQVVAPVGPVLTEEQQAITQIQRLGAFVTMQGETIELINLQQAVDLDKAMELVRRIPKPDSIRITAACLTPARADILKTLTGLRRIEADSSAITDEHLKALAELTELQELSLSSNPITDAGLAHLKGMTNLKRLYLKDTKLTSAGLTHLKGLTALNMLDLSQTRITNAGLAHLKGLNNLIGLFLRHTDVTDEGVADLRRSLPRANVVGP